jgi:ABC-type amino acid transport substrate-binding protein
LFSEFRAYFAGRQRTWIDILVVCLLPLFLSIRAIAADYSIVTIDFAPWSMDGRTGIFLDIVKEIENRLGTNNTPRQLPLNRALKYDEVTNGSYILVPVTRTDSFEKDWTWIVEVMPLEIVFVTVGGDPVDLEAASGLERIIAYKNLPAYKLLAQKSFKNLDAYPWGKPALLKMLAVGRADAWCVDRSFARFIARGTPYESQLVFGPPIFKSGLYIAGTKNIAPQIVTDYRRVFEEIRQEGFVDEIIIKYLGE